MSQHKKHTSAGRLLEYGYDLPCGGFFGTIYMNNSDIIAEGDYWDEDDVYATIGFGKGVSLEVLTKWCREMGAALTDEEITRLNKDRNEADDKGLTPLQELVNSTSSQADELSKIFGPPQ